MNRRKFALVSLKSVAAFVLAPFMPYVAELISPPKPNLFAGYILRDGGRYDIIVGPDGGLESVTNLFVIGNEEYLATADAVYAKPYRIDPEGGIDRRRSFTCSQPNSSAHP